MADLKEMVDKVTDKDMQISLQAMVESKVLEIVKVRHFEWERCEVESLQSIMVESFLFPEGRVANVLKELVKSNQDSTRIIFVEILKKNQSISQDIAELCIDWLKKAIDNSRQTYVRREERISEMYRSVGTLLEIKSIKENSDLVRQLEITVKVEVDKIDIQTFMYAASEVEKISGKGKELYNIHAQEKSMKYEDKLKNGKLNSHLEAVLGTVAKTSLHLDNL